MLVAHCEWYTYRRVGGVEQNFQLVLVSGGSGTERKVMAQQGSVLFDRTGRGGRLSHGGGHFVGGGGELGLNGLVHVKGSGSHTHTQHALHLRQQGLV